MSDKQVFVTELVVLRSDDAEDGTWPTLPLLQGDDVVYAEPCRRGNMRWIHAIVKREIRG